MLSTWQRDGVLIDFFAACVVAAIVGCVLGYAAFAN